MNFNRKTKRWMILVLLVAVWASGCSSQRPKPAPTAEIRITPTRLPSAVQTPLPTATPIPTITPSPTPGPTGKVTIMGWAEVQDWLQGAGVLDGFREAYPGIDLEWILGGPPEIMAALAEGQAGLRPDMVFVSDGDILALASDNALGDLAAGFGSREKEFLPYKQSLLVDGGHLWALPLDAQPAALFYRRDVFASAGLPSDPQQVDALLSTWDGYLQACRQIYAKTKTPCFASSKVNNDGRLLQVIAWQGGAGLYAEDGKPMLDQPALEQALTAMTVFWKEKLVVDELEWTNDWYNLLADSKTAVATAIEPMQFAGDLETWIAPNGAGQWGIVRIPALAAGQPRSAGFGGLNIALTRAGASGADQKAIQAFLDYLLFNPETREKLFRTANRIPGSDSAADMGVIGRKDAYFTGQDVSAFFNDIGGEIPAARMYGDKDSWVLDRLSQAIRSAAAGQNPQKALEQAQKEAESGQVSTPTPAPVPPTLPTDALPPG